MSALAGLGIDNVYIDLTATEVRSWTDRPAFRVPGAVRGIEEQSALKRLSGQERDQRRRRR